MANLTISPVTRVGILKTSTASCGQFILFIFLCC